MRSLPFLIMLGLGAPVLAQHQPDACVSVSDSNLPAALGAWAKAPVPAEAAASADGPRPELVPDRPLALRLKPAGAVTFAQAPGQLRKVEAAHGGLVAVRVPAEGTWRIAASGPVWIDLIGPAGPVASSGHGRMAPCTSIRKVVEFALPAGTWLVQLNGNPGPDLRLMLSRAP
jgi:hypothetical protein